MSPPSPPSDSPSGGARPRVEGAALGPYETNCYVVWVPPEPACWIIDASFSPGPLVGIVEREGLRPAALILTHAHVDHIAGVGELRRRFRDLPVLIHGAEERWLADPLLNLSALGGVSITAPGPDRLVQGGETLGLSETKWSVIHTPGHSPGGITLHHADSRTAFVGDALFAGSIGRTDFPGSDHDLLITSIRTKLFALPDDTRVYPGHGPPTTIGREKTTNPFVRG